MRKMILGFGLLIVSSIGAFAQSTGNCVQGAPFCNDSQTIITSGSTIIVGGNGGLIGSFEEIFNGSPATVSVVIQGCLTAGTCSTIDTNTVATNTVRTLNFSVVYAYFKVTASWTGGTNPSVQINTRLTTAGLPFGSSGTISGQTANTIPLATASTTIGSSTGITINGSGSSQVIGASGNLTLNDTLPTGYYPGTLAIGGDLWLSHDASSSSYGGIYYSGSSTLPSGLTKPQGSINSWGEDRKKEGQWGYNPDTTLTPLGALGNSGTTVTINTVNGSGGLTSVTVAGGLNLSVGQSLIVQQGSNYTGTLLVSSVSGTGAVTGATINSPGTGYTTAGATIGDWHYTKALAFDIPGDTGNEFYCLVNGLCGWSIGTAATDLTLSRGQNPNVAAGSGPQILTDSGNLSIYQDLIINTAAPTIHLPANGGSELIVYGAAESSLCAENMATPETGYLCMGVSSGDVSEMIGNGAISVNQGGTGGLGVNVPDGTAINAPLQVHVATNENLKVQNDGFGNLAMLSLNDAGSTYEPLDFFTGTVTFTHSGAVAMRSSETASANSTGILYSGAYTGNLMDVVEMLGQSGTNVINYGGGTSSGEPATTQNFYIGAAGTDAAGTNVLQLTSTGPRVLSSGASLGYGTGASVGGAITQGTSRTTGVTLNKATGQITLFAAAGSITATTFTVTDSAVAATDTVQVNESSGSNLYEIFVTAVGTGSFNITFFTTSGVTSDSPVFNFTVMKGSAS